MPQYPILQTKLYLPPIRPELVSRPRLIARLSEGVVDRHIAQHATHQSYPPIAEDILDPFPDRT